MDDTPLYRSTMDHMLSLDGLLHLNMRNPHMAFFNPKYEPPAPTKVSIEIKFFCIPEIYIISFIKFWNFI